MSKRLGLLGPIIVAVGAAVAAVGVWYVIHARPKPGDVIDTFDVGNGDTLVVRAEAGGDRSFLELRRKNDVVWQGLIPHYAGSKGRSGVAWSTTSVTVRIEREGRAEVFAMTLQAGEKLGGIRFAPEHEPIKTQTEGPLTITDHVRSYEIIGGTDWNQIVAVDLRSGKALWKADLGKGAITDGGMMGGEVWVTQSGHRRRFWVFTGREDESVN